MRASLPRDLCDQIPDIAAHMSTAPSLSPEMIDRAVHVFFVEI